MKHYILMAFGVATLAAATSQAGPIPQGSYLTCRGDGQTVLVFKDQSSYRLQVAVNNQLINVSTDLRYLEGSKSFVGRVGTDVLKSRGYTPNGPVTLDLVSKRFVVQDPYTGSASIFHQGMNCEKTDLAGF